MKSPFDDVCCALLPREALARLAPLRCEPGVQLAQTADRVWVRWELGNEHVLRAVLPLHDGALFAFRDGAWHRFAEALPAFDFPARLDFQPLAHVLFPAPVQPLPARDPAVQPTRL